MKTIHAGTVVVVLPDYSTLPNVHQQAWWAWVERQAAQADATLKAQLAEWRRYCREARITEKFEAVGKAMSDAARAAAAWLAAKWVVYHQRQTTAYRAIQLGVA